MDPQIWTPPKAANRLVKVIEQFSLHHGFDRFPTDVKNIALEAANIFGWKDPITEVQGADIKGFDGALFPDDNRSKWMLLFNDSLESQGRIRFTQGHELGHYILHRTIRDSFQCGDSSVLAWPGDEGNIETQADEFASYLLMPIDDFRRQVNADIDLSVLSVCAERYGVSITAAVLKWIKFTEEKAVLVISKSGYIDWAWSSTSAFSAGAYFKTHGQITEVPQDTLAADDSVSSELKGKNVSSDKWFKHASTNDAPVREMKLTMDRYERVLTLLILPRYLSVWPPRS